MVNSIRTFRNALVCSLTLTTLLLARTQAATETAAIPPVDREFRGLWIATVDNVDWPTKHDFSTRDQKASLIAIMDKAVQMHLNAIVLQVRPCCDALYDSKIEPWSEYLTGQMGKAPKPYYDPLAFAVEEAHKRGLELHAWFNPYRARFRDSKSPIARNHISVTHPELVRTYGKFLWLDPTDAATRAYSLNVIMDVVHRYDIDGVHFDDYFYPYPEKAKPSDGGEMEFPDGANWARYVKSGGKMSRADWRRDNVNMFVRAVYDSIKRDKPWVKFGVSPFGIWQPQHPQGITGFDSYDKLYCDSRQWLANGWVDYLAPQLYWPIAQKAQSFPVLLSWWLAQNPLHRQIYTGMRVEGWKNISNDARELTDEIIDTRRHAGATGEILWHSKPLMADHAGLPATLRTIYDEPALTPSYPWLTKDTPARPVVTAKESHHAIRLTSKDASGSTWEWVLRVKTGNHWTTQILPGSQLKVELGAKTAAEEPQLIAVSAVNRYGNMSEAAVLNTAHLGK